MGKKLYYHLSGRWTTSCFKNAPLFFYQVLFFTIQSAESLMAQCRHWPCCGSTSLFLPTRGQHCGKDITTGESTLPWTAGRVPSYRRATLWVLPAEMKCCMLFSSTYIVKIQNQFIWTSFTIVSNVIFSVQSYCTQCRKEGPLIKSISAAPP